VDDGSNGAISGTKKSTAILEKFQVAISP